MTLKNLWYSEYEGESKCWALDSADFVDFNLVVGRNATGKSRLIAVISGLCQILSGKNTNIFDSGHYKAEIQLGDSVYLLEIKLREKNVELEKLSVNGELRMLRGYDGKGEIYYQDEGKFMPFIQQSDTLTLQQRRDALQHPYIVALADWAKGALTYFFNRSFTNHELITLSYINSPSNSNQNAAGELIASYARAFQKFKEPYDRAIIADMKAIGYNLDDVGADHASSLMGLQVPDEVISMYVVESDRPDHKISQGAMSQGMFRALGLICQVNAAAFAKEHTLILIDDIGEGLDYERSVGLLDVLMRHSKDSNIQVILTTNDRFIMNSVPLENWSYLKRDKSIVRAYTSRSNPEKFENFKFLGLSNFDFFTSAEF
jgi:predicted ATP-dependent endonuclease of OLD family